MPPRDKSPGVAFALTFFLGPFGVFYVSVGWAIVLILLTLLTFGFGIVITYPWAIVLACLRASRQHAAFQVWMLQTVAASRPVV